MPGSTPAAAYSRSQRVHRCSGAFVFSHRTSGAPGPCEAAATPTTKPLATFNSLKVPPQGAGNVVPRTHVWKRVLHSCCTTYLGPFRVTLEPSAGFPIEIQYSGTYRLSRHRALIHTTHGLWERRPMQGAYLSAVLAGNTAMTGLSIHFVGALFLRTLCLCRHC